jgi:hypothetical protein
MCLCPINQHDMIFILINYDLNYNIYFFRSNTMKFKNLNYVVWLHSVYNKTKRTTLEVFFYYFFILLLILARERLES